MKTPDLINKISNSFLNGRLFKKPSLSNDPERVYHKLKRHRGYVAQMQQDELKKAIQLAENPESLNRKILYNIYREAVRDRHLYSSINTLVLKITGSPFAVYYKGTNVVDKQATRMIQTPWFDDYQKHFHWTPWWGHSLVEFQEMHESEKEGLDYEFKKIKLIPREHVMPQLGLITLYPQDETTGIPFRKEPFNRWIMEMGNEDDLGLLHMVAEEVIWKRYARTDWSRQSEKFGMPLLAIKTSTKQEKEIDKIEDMAANFGANGYVILDEEDGIEIKERSNSNSYQIYKEKAHLCNQEMSKLISGQTLTSGTDGKGSYALGRVHADVLNEYQEAGMRSEMFHVNDELFPFLKRHGYPLEGREFKYLAFVNEIKRGVINPGDQDPNGLLKSKNLPEGTVVSFRF